MQSSQIVNDAIPFVDIGVFLFSEMTAQDFSSRVSVGDKIYVTHAGGTWDEVTDAVGIVTSITDGGAIPGQISVNMNWISGDVYYGLEDRHYDMSVEKIAILEDDNEIELQMFEDRIPLIGTSENYLVHGGDLSQFGDIDSVDIGGSYSEGGSMFYATAENQSDASAVYAILSQYPPKDITWNQSQSSVRPSVTTSPSSKGCSQINLNQSTVNLLSETTGESSWPGCTYLAVYNKYDKTNVMYFVDRSIL